MEYRLTEYLACTRVKCCGGDTRRRRAGNDMRILSAAYSVLVICWGHRLSSLKAPPVTPAVTSLLLLDATAKAPIVHYRVQCLTVDVKMISARRELLAPNLIPQHHDRASNTTCVKILMTPSTLRVSA